MATAQAALPDIFLYVTARYAKEWPHEPSPAFWGDAAETGPACSAQQPHQYCFRLVIGVVPQSNGNGAMPAGDIVEKGVSRLPARLFQGKLFQTAEFSHVNTGNLCREAIAFGKPADEHLVAVRFRSAQGMIEVSDDQVKAQVMETGENIEQGYGIGPSGDRNNYGVSGRKEAIRGNSLNDSGSQLCS
jgi:hypothetical protein